MNMDEEFLLDETEEVDLSSDDEIYDSFGEEACYDD